MAVGTIATGLATHNLRLVRLGRSYVWVVAAAAVVVACPSQHTALEPGSLPGRLRVVSPARFYAEVGALADRVGYNP